MMRIGIQAPEDNHWVINVISVFNVHQCWEFTDTEKYPWGSDAAQCALYKQYMTVFMSTIIEYYYKSALIEQVHMMNAKVARCLLKWVAHMWQQIHVPTNCPKETHLCSSSCSSLWKIVTAHHLILPFHCSPLLPWTCCLWSSRLFAWCPLVCIFSGRMFSCSWPCCW